MKNKILSIFMIVSMVMNGLIAGQLLFSTHTIAPGPYLPDLTISEQNISISPVTSKVGDSVSIYADVWNVGTADTTNVTVSFYEDETSIGITNIIHSQVSKYWNCKTIDSTGDVGGYSSMALDSVSGIHISYFDSTNDDLKYAYKPFGGNWTTQTIDSPYDVGRYSSIAVDGANNIHISYFNNTNDDLKYAFKPSGGSWTTHTVDSPGQVGAWTSIAVDSLDGVHISYYEGYPIEDLKYAYKPSGGEWTNYTVDSLNAVGVGTSIAMDSADGVHISYFDYNNTALKYAYKPSGGIWSYNQIDIVGDSDFRSSIAVDDANDIHISYYDSINNELKYAYKPSGGSWTNYTVDSSDSVGYGNSIAIDSAKGIHISYRDWTNRDLKYAYKPSGENWTIHFVDSQGDVGLETSIAVDNSNNAHISYRDWGKRDLKYANQITPSAMVRVVCSWTPTTPGLRNITVKIDENNEIEELNETNNEATISINIEQGSLWNIVVTPSSATIELNKTQQFIAKGYDKYTNEVPISPTWEVNGGGIIDQNGLFTANYPGTWTVHADQDNHWNISDAMVTVLVNDTADTDLDGILDWWEIAYMLDPFNSSDSFLDPDQDGLSNLQEFLNSSSPTKTDTDGDNLGDGFEVIFSKTKPNDWDTNNNSIGDGLEFIEGQGYLGWIELLPDNWIGMTISWDNYTVYVKTNSSVLEGEFDKDEQKLKIKVSGPEGTTGVTEIDVPKSLCEPDDIEIMLDGELIDFTLTEDDTYYYIHIEYNHSAHELTADFTRVIDEPMESEDDEEILPIQYLIFMVVVIILIIIILLGITRYRNGFQRNEVPDLPPHELSKMLEERHAGGEMTDETYNDIKSLLKKYEDSDDNH